ncbi:MAG TPA: hypothetical protein VFI47_25315 [Acidimicrobiales bacterium]|nr:hypothetical protein [Acidimicrobiales bacterium]
MTPLARLGPRGRLLVLGLAAAALIVPLVVVDVVGSDAASGAGNSPERGNEAAAPAAETAGAAAPVSGPQGRRGPRCWGRTQFRWCRPVVPATAPPATEAAAAAGAPAGGPVADYVPGEFPNPASTGVPAGWQPAAVHEGDLWVYEPGAVIEDMLVTGAIQVRAENVTIRRTRVKGIIWNQYSDSEQFGGLLIEDTEVGPDSGVMTDWGHGAVGTAGYTARRVEIHNVTDGFRVSGDDILIEDSFVTLAVVDGECNHLDAVQGYGGGNNVVVRGNTLDARGYCSNASVFMADSSPHADVQGNLLLGGTYSLRLNQFEIPATFVAKNNRIVDGSWQYGAMDIVDKGALNFTCGGNQVVTIDSNYQVTGVVRDLPC